MPDDISSAARRRAVASQSSPSAGGFRESSAPALEVFTLPRRRMRKRADF